MGVEVNAAPRLLYPREKPGTRSIGGCVGPRAALKGCEKYRPHWGSNRPARNKSLYRLHYPGPSCSVVFGRVDCHRVQVSSAPTRVNCTFLDVEELNLCFKLLISYAYMSVCLYGAEKLNACKLQ